MIDARIPLGVQNPQFQTQQQSPINMLAQVMQLKDAQANSQVNALKMQEYQRGIEESNKLNALYSGAVGPDGKIDRTKLLTGAATGGLGSKIPALQKQFAETDKANVDLDKTRIETAHKRVEMMGQSLGWLRQNPTMENAQMAIKHLVDNGVMPQEKAQEAMSTFMANPTPQGIAQFATMGYQAALSAKDQLPTYQTRNTGGTTDTLAIDPVSGKVNVANSVQNTQSPDNKASVGASMANAAAVRETAAATRDAAATTAAGIRDAASIKDKRDTELKISDDYRTQSKPFKEVSDAYRTITASLDKATTSPAATLAGATKFMKLLDPGSVVRESELGMALAATGVLDRAANYHQTLLRGKVLTPKQTEDFKAIAGQIYQAAQSQQQMIDKDYSGKAKQYGLRPEMIVQDLGQGNAAPAPTASGLPPGWTVKAK